MGRESHKKRRGQAHKASKVPLKPENDSAPDDADRPTCCPYNVLLGEVNSWDHVWRGDDTSPEEHAQALTILNEALRLDPQPLSPITGTDVAQSSVAFKRKTVSPCGWHPRTYSLVSKESQDSLGRLLSQCEWNGMWPEEESSIHMSIQRKPAGGKRLIGWYRALFRLWCMCRSDLWKEWEDRHGSATFFSAAKGNSVIDVGWRQAVRSEVARLEGKEVIIIAQDLKKVLRIHPLPHPVRKSDRKTFPPCAC